MGPTRDPFVRRTPLGFFGWWSNWTNCLRIVMLAKWSIFLSPLEVGWCWFVEISHQTSFSLMMSTLQRTDYHCVLWLSCCWYGSTTNPVGITTDLPWFTQLLLKLDCTIVHWTSEHLIKKTNVASCTVLYSVGTRTLRSHKCKCLFDCEGLGSTFIRFRARKSGLASCPNFSWDTMRTNETKRGLCDFPNIIQHAHFISPNITACASTARCIAMWHVYISMFS